MISLNQNLKPKFTVYFFCTSNFLALIILPSETVKLNVSCSGGLRIGLASISMRGGRKPDIMDFLYIIHEL